jgi:hypothetical protein
MVQWGTVGNTLKRSGTVWHSLEQFDIVGNDIVQTGTVANSREQSETVRKS